MRYLKSYVQFSPSHLTEALSISEIFWNETYYSE
jgi:hypothetical protein